MKSIYRLILCISRNTCFIHRVQLLISRVDTPRRTTSSFVSFLPYLRPVAEVAVIQRRSNATLPSCLEPSRVSIRTRTSRNSQRERNKSRIFRKSGHPFVSSSFRSTPAFSIPSIKTRIRGENCFSVIFPWYFHDGIRFYSYPMFRCFK